MDSSDESISDRYEEESSDENKPGINIGEKEQKAVVRSKNFVGIFLLCTAITAGVFTFLFTSKQEQNTFRAEFVGLASEITVVVGINEEKLAKVTADFSTQITSFALSTNATWPFIKLPFFEARGQSSMSIAKTDSMAMAMIVAPEEREEWEAFAFENQGWINDDRNLLGKDQPDEPPISKSIMKVGPNGFEPEDGPGPYVNLWQLTPFRHFVVNLNIAWNPISLKLINFIAETQQPTLSDFRDLESFVDGEVAHPTSIYNYPIFDTLGGARKVVGFLIPIVSWNIFFENILNEGENAVICVVRNTCADQVITYKIDGPEAIYLGPGDLHESVFDEMEQKASFKQFEKVKSGGETCGYSLHIYPSVELRSSYETDTPLIFTITVVFVFAFTSLVFILYDIMVQRRQDKVMSTALRTDAIVSSLFPAQFRDQLFSNNNTAPDDISACTMNTNKSSGYLASKQRLKSYVTGGEGEGEDIFMSSKPLADLFAHTTVMFADIAGFTSWSSIREPGQVFTLLEALYNAFDVIGKRRKVFKVETVGDSYVAVVGVPDVRRDHAVVMARFARDCAARMPEVVRKLERVLGPGTADLTMRFGLHSGAVTAGVLRGEKARFQLFGDTVNMAARMESTGVGSRVQISATTASLLAESGKGGWFKPREGVVHVKGKGEMQTFWLLSNAESRAGSARDSSESPNSIGNGYDWADANVRAHQESSSEQTQRLVEWNFEMLSQLLVQIKASRRTSLRGGTSSKLKTPEESCKFVTSKGRGANEGIVLDEVVEIIAMPGFDSEKSAHNNDVDLESVDIGAKAKAQLYNYIALVAYGYNDNPFHNFEHASHVAMSVHKLLSRIVAPDVDMEEDHVDSHEYASRLLHDHTYGITSDPLTQFAVVLSALIHDIDHRGVPNSQLCKEDAAMAATYRNKSVAEQNSVDLGWNMLMTGDFEDLRDCIYSSDAELKRFRQIIVNNVMATDIFDKELSTLRKNRWEKAFAKQPYQNADPTSAAEEEIDRVNRKATIVIEHLLQASDVSHTMQHWHVYTKWNEKLFHEMYLAYKSGRADKDPSVGWAGGEIWFFDNYVIPLAKKLDECGVFGVSSDEYLGYAIANRDEWEKKGKDIVASMVEKYSDIQASGGPENSNQET